MTPTLIRLFNPRSRWARRAVRAAPARRTRHRRCCARQARWGNHPRAGPDEPRHRGTPTSVPRRVELRLVGQSRDPAVPGRRERLDGLLDPVAVLAQHGIRRQADRRAVQEDHWHPLLAIPLQVRPAAAPEPVGWDGSAAPPRQHRHRRRAALPVRQPRDRTDGDQHGDADRREDLKRQDVRQQRLLVHLPHDLAGVRDAVPRRRGGAGRWLHRAVPRRRLDRPLVLARVRQHHDRDELRRRVRGRLPARREAPRRPRDL